MGFELIIFVIVYNSIIMGAAELKNTINRYMIDADEKVLRIVKAVFESYREENKDVDFYDELPVDIQDLLFESRKDISNGDFFSHKQVMSEINQKFNITD